MKIMSLRNGDDSVNNEFAGRVVYRFTSIPSWRNFHIKEKQLDIFFLLISEQCKTLDWCE